MADDDFVAPVAKCCTLCCFNFFFFVSGIFFIVKIFGLLNAKAIAKFGVGPSYNTAFYLAIILGIFIIALAIFGCVALFLDKPALFAVYGILLLVSLGLEIAGNIFIDRAGFEIGGNEIKLKVLPKFDNIGFDIRMVVQATQLKYSCCGYDSYQDYLDSDESKDAVDKIPDSCCGKFDTEKDSTLKRGGCLFDEYSAKKGCGFRLSKAYLAQQANSSEVIFTISTVLTVICYILQAMAVAGSFYIFFAMTRHGSKQQVIYSGN